MLNCGWDKTLTKKTHKAIILAAGKGLRLRKILKGKPKPLLKIGNKTLIENLIEKLKDLNVKKNYISYWL